MTTGQFARLRDVYIRAARELYREITKAPVISDADAVAILKRARAMRDLAYETWLPTVRQSRELGMLDAEASLKTQEGRDKRDRLVASLTPDAP
jgi:hypothetical protein